MHEQKTFENNSFSRIIRSLFLLSFSCFHSLTHAYTLKTLFNENSYIYLCTFCLSRTITQCAMVCVCVSLFFLKKNSYSFILIRKVCVHTLTREKNSVIKNDKISACFRSKTHAYIYSFQEYIHICLCNSS